MPELPFPDLATDVARATEPPPFEHIVRRARRHRRRQVMSAATAIAAVLAVIVIVAAQSVGGRTTTPPVAPSSPRPSGSAAPSPTPDRAPDVETILRDGNLGSYAAADDGSLLTIWNLCTDTDNQDCHSAWQLETAAGRHHGSAPGDSPMAHTGVDGYVVKAWNGRGIVVGLDGSVRPVVDGEPKAAAAGDVVVPGRNRLLLVDPRTAQSWPLPRPADVQRWDQAVVDGDGTIWATALVGREVWIAWSVDGASWSHHVMPADHPYALPGYIATAGDHVASVSGYDGATILPVADLAVTADGGRTWTDLHQKDLPFDTVDAMAATSGGTLYVVTAGAEHLYRSTDTSWTRFAEVADPDRVDVLAPAGDRVIGLGGSYPDARLFEFDDAGRARPLGVSR